MCSINDFICSERPENLNNLQFSAEQTFNWPELLCLYRVSVIEWLKAGVAVKYCRANVFHSSPNQQTSEKHSTNIGPHHPSRIRYQPSQEPVVFLMDWKHLRALYSSHARLQLRSTGRTPFPDQTTEAGHTLNNTLVTVNVSGGVFPTLI